VVVLPDEGVRPPRRDGIEPAAVVGLAGRPVPGDPVGREAAVDLPELVAGIPEGGEPVGVEDDDRPADGDREGAAGAPDDRPRDAEGLVGIDTEDDRLRVEVLAVPFAASGPAVGRQGEPLVLGVVAVRGGVVVDGRRPVAVAGGLALAAGARTTPSWARKTSYSTTAAGRTVSPVPRGGSAMRSPGDRFRSEPVSRSYITRSSSASFPETPKENRRPSIGGRGRRRCRRAGTRSPQPAGWRRRQRFHGGDTEAGRPAPARRPARGRRPGRRPRRRSRARTPGRRRSESRPSGRPVRRSGSSHDPGAERVSSPAGRFGRHLGARRRPSRGRHPRGVSVVADRFPSLTVS